MKTQEQTVLPNFETYTRDGAVSTWDVLSMNWCIDFGGRQCQIECQRNNGDGKYPEKSFTIYALSGEFVQRDKKETEDATPVPNTEFYTCIMDMFHTFDKVKNPKFPVAGKKSA